MYTNIYQYISKDIYGADIIYDDVKGELNSSVIDPPDTCALKSDATCDQTGNLELGTNFEIDFTDKINAGLHFRIEKIWVG